MSMDPSSMQQLIMQQLSQRPQAGTQGQGATMGQGQISPMNAAANVAQKIVLMKALQNQQIKAQQQQFQQGLPQTQQQMQSDPQMQALQQSPALQPPPNPFQPMGFGGGTSPLPATTPGFS